MIFPNYYLNKLWITALCLLVFFGGCSKSKDLIVEENTTIVDTPNKLPKIDLIAGNNVYGHVVDENLKPIEGVIVTDGSSVVKTDAKGEYQFKKSTDAQFVYYSTPKEYEINTSVDRKMALFYQKLNTTDRPHQYDFYLKSLKSVEKKFLVFAIGDPQVASDDEVKRFKDETMSDIIQEISKVSLPVYGLSMGDVIADKPNLFNAMKTVMGSSTMPVFTTIGNHDKTGGSATIPRNSQSFESHFGPLNFSFDRGNVHFVFLDNVVFSNNSDYTLGFSTKQMDWLEKDLAHVSNEKLVILNYHMPIRNSSFATRSRFFDIIKDFKNIHFFSGHTHYSENYIHNVNGVEIYEHIHAATCGAWWKSTINGDGTPNGYGVYEIDDTAIKNWYYKPTKLSANYQVRLHWGDTKFGGTYGTYDYGKSANTLIANVWNADPLWKVEVYMDGSKLGNMTLNNSLNKDAWSLGYHLGVLNRNVTNYTTATKHLYTFDILNPNNTLKVVVTDRFGKTYEQSEIISDLQTAIGY